MVTIHDRQFMSGVASVAAAKSLCEIVVETSLQSRRIPVAGRNRHRVLALPLLKRRIKEALQTILDDPYSAKALTEELKGLRSFRIGRIRIIYAITSKTVIEIVAVGPRRTVYEETYRIISRE